VLGRSGVFEMKKALVLLIPVLVLGLAGQGWCATYYVRPTTDLPGYGYGDGSDYDNAFSGFADISVLAGNHALCICGAFNEKLTWSTSGSAVGTEFNVRFGCPDLDSRCTDGIIDRQSGEANGMEIDNCSYVKVWDADIRNCGSTTAKVGLSINAENGNVSNIIILGISSTDGGTNTDGVWISGRDDGAGTKYTVDTVDILGTPAHPITVTGNGKCGIRVNGFGETNVTIDGGSGFDCKISNNGTENRSANYDVGQAVSFQSQRFITGTMSDTWTDDGDYFSCTGGDCTNVESYTISAVYNKTDGVWLTKETGTCPSALSGKQDKFCQDGSRELYMVLTDGNDDPDGHDMTFGLGVSENHLLKRCEISGQYDDNEAGAVSEGVGVYVDHMADNVTLSQLIIHDNEGAGIASACAKNLTVRHVLLYDNGLGPNHAKPYGIYLRKGVDTPKILNCTLEGHTAGDSIYLEDEIFSPQIADTIIRNDGGAPINDQATAQNESCSYSALDANPTNIDCATGSVDSDPLFKDVSNKNYRLQASSPCRDAGDSSVWTGTLNVVDLAGKSITDGTGAIVAAGGTVDIGAYEYQSSGGNDMDDGESKGGGCFIATTIHGSPVEPHVMILREFRDSFLLTNPTGWAFVNLYNP